ncbi:MAG: hypothetical protein JW774_02630 [Candidatus Aureabacteria bacterium]|nr:hypothetical protein [Candidatus Auribacterota bacterium]
MKTNSKCKSSFTIPDPFNKTSEILIMAAGGSGMNVLAQHLLSQGLSVSGMDRDFDRGWKERIRSCLHSLGMTIVREDGDLPDKAFDLILVSPAVEKAHPVLGYARERKIPVQTRSEFLVSIFNHSKGMGISGTSGKTTVTGMLASICHYQDRPKPVVFCGDEILNFSSPIRLGNYLPGDSKEMILELDESDGLLPSYQPYLSCITNIQRDHYSVEELEGLFVKLTKNSGKTVVNVDCPVSRKIAENFSDKIIRVSLTDPEVNYYGKLLKVGENEIRYSINDYAGILPISGSYNVKNALMAIAMACENGIPLKAAVQALESFKGIRNRFEIKKKGKSFFILDFAHNPEKIRASLNSAQEMGLPVYYVFQPHGYNPLKFMMKEFGDMFRQELREDDRLILLKIYDAGGTADRSVHSRDLLQLINRKNVSYMEDWDEMIQLSSSLKNIPLCWVVAGARDEKLKDLRDGIMGIS